MTRSEELFELAQQHLAGGVGSGTRAPRSGWLPYPIFVQSGQGSHVTDVDGNDYIDYALGLGPLILGHRPPAVVEAVTKVLTERGSLFALAHDLEGQAAAMLSARVPSMELLRFGNSGTECVEYAIRFARAFTGRRLIVRFVGHYHGWSDTIHWAAHPSLEEMGPDDAPAAVPGSTGMCAGDAQDLVVASWNDVGLLERVFAEHGDQIAAVITEPIAGNMGGVMPLPGYLEVVRRLCTRHSALLIFDEVLTGLRVARGGAQQLFGVKPDLTVLGKALAAGFPVAAVGGRRDVMEMVADGRTMHGGTYNSSPLVCAAVIAALQVTGERDFYSDLGRRGLRLATGLMDAAHAADLDAAWAGVGQMGQFWFAPRAPTTYRQCLEMVAASPFLTLYEEFRRRGVIVQPSQEGLFFVSSAHSDADIERTIEIAREAMPLVAQAAASGQVGPRGEVR